MMINLLKKYYDTCYTFLYNFCSVIYRDLVGIFYVLKIESQIYNFTRKNHVLADLFRKCLNKHPHKPCIVFQDQVWTFQDIEDYSNKIARIFLENYGLKKGDCVALLLENKPEYVAIWLGLSKIGVISALINTNLKHQPLLHSLRSVEPKAIVYGTNFEASIDTVRNELDKKINLLIEDYDNSLPIQSKAINLNDLILKTISEPLIAPEKSTPSDPIMYIYTSGTTGLPKPAIIRQSRYCSGGLLFYEIAGLNQADIVYVTLPIYHANGAIIGVGMSIVSGATVVLKNKFSASGFWKDCIQYKCTAFIYVGEICRFLVNQPVSELDRKHSIKKAIGNGLRENVWHEFYNRFNVKCIEFYAASEGNCTMININSKIGSCGFTPLLNKYIKFLSVYIIRIDNDMNPIRDENGFCIECKPNERGLLIGMIGTSAKTAYTGYANNKKASNGKIIENVFKMGQNAFNSGDSMIVDSWGYMYFCDRLGDTFRWRGENVATVEVENTISSHLKSSEVSVYGVEVPGQEGKAGMAAIMKEDLDIDLLCEHLKANLPAYARPLFIRLSKEFDYTGTFKTIKKRLVDEGYDITLVSDKLFYYDNKIQKFVELTKQVYTDLKNGNIRL